MSNTDIDTFKQVLERFEPEDLVPDTLESAIRSISRWYAINKERGKKVSGTKFHERYGLTLLHFGIDDLFEAKNYRSALGCYFSHRSVLARLKKPLVEEPVAPINKVGMMMGVSRDQASVFATPNDILKFTAGNKPIGHLSWNDIKAVSGEWVSDEAYQKAHQQALAAMNQRRKND